jgi:Domain of unknown function (DUF1844)
MAKKNEPSTFTVTDRRLFTSDGELRNDVPAEKEEPKPVPAPTVVPEAAATGPLEEMSSAGPARLKEEAVGAAAIDIPVPPSSAEQEAQAAAYRQSSKDLDSQVELSGRSAKEFEMTFERFMASLYMTAMMQMGLMHEQGGEPRIDIIGARQTIDTLSLLAEKTKGNLTAVEQNFLQNTLYELRMAYVEVTNMLARPPQPGPVTGTTGR